VPPCLRDLKRALENQNGTMEKPGSGSHWKAKLGSDCFPVPAHNGLKTQISKRYLDGLCRALKKLDEGKFRGDL
jgi:hypothetical protein